MTTERGHATRGLALGGRYLLGSRIATGGMGEVWRACDTVLDREVAVKLLKAEYADDPSFTARFAAEARNAAALHHPHVAAIFDFGELRDDDGSGCTRPFLVMELVPGQPLSALLDGRGMPPWTAADLVAQAADAIAAAHKAGIVHRDVKPANLLVTPEGAVKITDFGIARAAGAVALTQTGQIVGTPHYISPEQVEGRAATPASDIYALGVVLYECLAGHRPFAGDTPVSTALAHLREPVPPLPGTIPGHLRAIVDRALAKDPADRFESAADLSTALHEGLDDAAPGRSTVRTGLVAADLARRTVETTPAPLSTRVLGHRTTPATARRLLTGPPWWSWVAAAAGVLLVVGLATILGNGDTGRTAEDDLASAENAQPEDAQPADDRVRVREGDYVGSDQTEARTALEQRGFTVEGETRPATSPGLTDTVAAVVPSGLIEPGATITLTVWEQPAGTVEADGDAGPKPGKGDKPGPDKSDKPGPDQGKKNGDPKGKKQP